MTGRRDRGDCCPACGSDDVIPFAFIFGAVELYGYQCPCGRAWLSLHAQTRYDTLALRAIRGRAG
jgi:hypothetical protein